MLIAIALIAAGRGDSMAQAWPDRRYLSLPEDRSLTADDVESLRLAVAFRGYRMEEVDDLLDRISVELAARDTYIERLRQELAGAAGEAGHGHGGPAAPPAETTEASAEPGATARDPWAPPRRRGEPPDDHRDAKQSASGLEARSDQARSGQ